MLAKLGTLLAFQRLRIYVFRQLFKKMYLLMDKPTRISLSHLMVPFALMQEPMDLITIQELLVNLIDKVYDYLCNPMWLANELLVGLCQRLPVRGEIHAGSQPLESISFIKLSKLFLNTS